MNSQGTPDRQRPGAGRGGLGRRARFLLPSLVAAAAGSLAAGLLDGAIHAGGVGPAFAAAGFSGVLVLPALLAASLLVRGLIRAWGPRELGRRLSGPSGSSPRLAAWLTFLLVAVWLLSAFTFNVVLNAVYRTPAKEVQALVAMLAVAGMAAVLVALSWPAVRLLTGLYRALDRAAERRLGRAVLKPRLVLAAAAGALVLLVLGAWAISVRPRIGYLDIAPVLYLGAGGAACLLVHALWPGIRRRRLLVPALAALGALLVGATSAALWARHARPFAMLEVWGQTRLAGPAIDQLYDIQVLRSAFQLREFRPPARPGAEPRDVVLITVDTFRADRAPIYGGPATMPELLRFSREAAVFDWAFSPGNVTRRSLPTIATGLSPHRVRGRVAGWALRLDPRHVLLAERLRAAGYATAGFFCCESLFGPRHRLGLIRGIDHLVLGRPAEELVEESMRWLAEPRDQPIFVWFHFIDPHGWERDYPRPKFGHTYAERYDHALAAVDRLLAGIFAGYYSEERRARTYLVMTSDHGQGLGDHGERFHATQLYNSQIRVPLVIAGPGVRAGRIPQPTGLVDLAPTILDLAGFEPPGMPQMDGVSLAPLLRGEVAPALEAGEAYAVMVEDRSVEADAWAIIAGRHKLIVRDGDPEVELFDFIADRGEKRNLAKKDPERLQELLKRLAARRAIDTIPAF